MKTSMVTMVAVGLGVVAGCGGGDDEFDHYFAGRPYVNAACNATDGQLAMRREMHLFTYANSDVPPFSRALQRYYRRHGLAFFSNDPVRTIPQPYVLDTDDSALNDGLAREFPGVNLDDEAALMRDPVLYDRIIKYTINFLFRPVIEFARVNGTVGVNVTNLVIVPDILRPGGDLGFSGGRVVGLAVSPTLLQVFGGQDLPEGRAWKALDLPPEFTPMMFLDGRTLGNLLGGAPDLADLVAAHEFGHTGGLVHRMEDHNLMLPAVMPGISACTDSLDPDQIATLRATFGLTAGAAPLRLQEKPPQAGGLAAVLPPAELSAVRRGDRRALARLVRRFAD